LKELAPLALGLLLTAVALAAAGRRIAAVEKDIRQQASPVDVVVASVPIASGEPFSERNLAKKSVPSAGTGRRNVPASEHELLLGARARVPVAAGEPVFWTDVEEPYETDAFSRGIAPGRRALTLGADMTSSFAGMLHPGDRVDLLCGTDGKSRSEWVRDIPVAAVDRNHARLGRPSDGAEPASVTLMVTPEEGARISHFAGSGKLHWFLRNPEDNTAHPRPGKPESRRSLPVEIWKAGVRELPRPRDMETSN
jgi:Flp pilus assembly protein CpaB